MAKQTIHPLGAEADYETALKEIEFVNGLANASYPSLAAVPSRPRYGRGAAIRSLAYGLAIRSGRTEAQH